MNPRSLIELAKEAIIYTIDPQTEDEFTHYMIKATALPADIIKIRSFDDDSEDVDRSGYYAEERKKNPLLVPPQGTIDRNNFIAQFLHESTKLRGCKIKGGVALSLLCRKRVRDIDMELGEGEFSSITEDLFDIFSHIEGEMQYPAAVNKTPYCPRLELTLSMGKNYLKRSITCTVTCVLDKPGSLLLTQKEIYADMSILDFSRFDHHDYKTRLHERMRQDDRKVLFEVSIDISSTTSIPDFTVNLFTVVKSSNSTLYNPENTHYGYLQCSDATLQTAMQDLENRIARPLFHNGKTYTCRPEKHCHLSIDRFGGRITKMKNKGFRIQDNFPCEPKGDVHFKNGTRTEAMLYHDCYFADSEKKRMIEQSNTEFKKWRDELSNMIDWLLNTPELATSDMKKLIVILNHAGEKILKRKPTTPFVKKDLKIKIQQTVDKNNKHVKLHIP